MIVEKVDYTIANTIYFHDYSRKSQTTRCDQGSEFVKKKLFLYSSSLS